MPLKTLALVGIASAAAGAAATSAFITSRKDNLRSTPATNSPATTLSDPPTSSLPSNNTAYSSLPTGPPPPTTPSTAYPPTPFPPPRNTPISSNPITSSASPVNPSGLFQYGFPGPISDLRTSPSLVSSFNRTTRNPNWVAEHITPASLAANNGNRRNSDFYEDPTIPPQFRAKLHDYLRSGYDRGHQVPAADAKWSQEAMNATFAMSNMCPQVGDGFNRDYWAHFEDFCRRLTRTYPSVRIVTGPLYLPKRDPKDGKWRVSYEVIGSPPNVAVPTHFYKVVYAEDGRVGGDVAVGAFVLPNAVISNERALGEFEVPLEVVERASGLEFATKLDKSRRRRLCADVDCGIVVQEYAKRQNAFGKGAQKERL